MGKRLRETLSPVPFANPRGLTKDLPFVDNRLVRRWIIRDPLEGKCRDSIPRIERAQPSHTRGSEKRVILRGDNLPSRQSEYFPHGAQGCLGHTRDDP